MIEVSRAAQDYLRDVMQEERDKRLRLYLSAG